MRIGNRNVYGGHISRARACRKNFRDREYSQKAFVFSTHAHVRIYLYTYVPRVEGLLSFIHEENKRPITTKRESECHIRHEIKNYTSYRRPWRADILFGSFHATRSIKMGAPTESRPRILHQQRTLPRVSIQSNGYIGSVKKILFPQDFFPWPFIYS